LWNINSTTLTCTTIAANESLSRTALTVRKICVSVYNKTQNISKESRSFGNNRPYYDSLY